MNRLGIRVSVFITVCSTYFISGVYAQEKVVSDTAINTDLTYVRWVSEFPATDSEQTKKGLWGRIGEFVFGKKPTVLVKPVAVLAQTPENYWVLDQKINSIVQVEQQKGTGFGLNMNDQEPYSSAVDICELPDERFLITDSRINKVLVYVNDEKNVSSLNTSLDLQQPTGIAYSPVSNEIWVLETKAHRIAILNSKGELIRTIGSRGSGTGEFNYPTHIWIDQKGLAYIVDSMNFRIQIYNSDGEFISMFGSHGDATGYFARPKGVATDSRGNIYVVDALFHNIQIFNKKGELLYNFGSQGRDKGDFWMPVGIFIDNNDYIYVADSYNSRVQVFQLINYE